MIKKVLAMAMAAVVSTSLFVGCGAKKDETSNKDNGEAVELQFWGDWTGEGEKWMDTMIEKFNKEYPNIKIDYVPQPELTDKLLTSVAAGTSPDILFWDRYLTSTYADKGFLLPIDELVKKNNVNLDLFYKNGLDELTYKDNLYGLPIISDTRVLAYNTKMFEEAGIKAPTTWDEIIAAGKKITKLNASGKAEQYLFSSNDTFSLLPYMLQAGGFPTDADGNLAYNSDAAKKAIGLWDQLLKDKSVVFSKTTLEDFVQGKSAMMFCDPDAITNVKKSAAEGFDYKFIEMPSGPNGDKGTLLGGFGLTIPKASKQQDAAFTFVNWWASNADNAKEFVNLASSLPSNTELGEKTSELHDAEALQSYISALEYAKARPSVTWWGEVDSKVIQMNLELFVQGKQTADETLKKIQDEGTALIKSLK